LALHKLSSYLLPCYRIIDLFINSGVSFHIWLFLSSSFQYNYLWNFRTEICLAKCL